MNILIVEDDIFLASQIQKAFLECRFSNRVEHISSYDAYIKQNPYIPSFDIILLDVNLGKKGENEGFDILSHIRENNTKLPIIMISSFSGYSFLEEAFARGAHDYIIKPFRNRELQIRIERWFRNYIFSEYFSINSILKYETITYDISLYEFYLGNHKILLSRGSKYIFSLFLIHREKLLSQDFLIEKIWGYSEKDYQKNLRIKIMRLKNQLQAVGIDTWIHNVRGEGYTFKKNVLVKKYEN